MYNARVSLLATVLVLLCVLPRSAYSAELEVAELVYGIKKSIAEAQKVAQPPFMKIPWMEVEISYVVKKEGGGAFKLYVITAEGKYATETVQRIKYRIEPADEGLVVQKPGEITKARVAGIGDLRSPVGPTQRIDLTMQEPCD
jgi:Trypsin-co-occurring domain 2